MRRSEIKRNVEAIRAWKNKPRKPLERSRIKKVGPKKKKELRETSKPRLELRREIGWCAACRESKLVKDLCVHEIPAGGNRAKAVYDRGAQLVVCRYGDCHDRAQYMSKAKQYALKAVQDPKHFDRVALNKYFGRGEKVSEQELADALIELFEF